MTLSHEQKTHFQHIVDTAPTAIQPLATALFKYMDNRDDDIERLIATQHYQTLQELFNGPFFDVLTLFLHRNAQIQLKR